MFSQRWWEVYGVNGMEGIFVVCSIPTRSAMGHLFISCQSKSTFCTNCNAIAAVEIEVFQLYVQIMYLKK